MERDLVTLIMGLVVFGALCSFAIAVLMTFLDSRR